MRRTLIATLMALAFGLFSMPAVQATTVNGMAIGSSIKTMSPIEKVQYWRRRRRRRQRCHWVHYRRSRSRQRCTWY
jgi:hypothetical protein